MRGGKKLVPTWALALAGFLTVSACAGAEDSDPADGGGADASEGVDACQSCATTCMALGASSTCGDAGCACICTTASCTDYCQRQAKAPSGCVAPNVGPLRCICQ